MYKVLVLYPTPHSPERFRAYYESTHLPLARELPGLLAYRYAFCSHESDGLLPYFCVWEGEFESGEKMRSAMESDIGKRVSADVGNYATGGAIVLHFDAIEGLAAASKNSS